MKLKLLVAYILFLGQFVFGQSENTTQVKNAESFLNAILKNDEMTCYKLLDTINVPSFKKEQFHQAFIQLNKEISIFDNFELTMSGVQLYENKKLNLYTFKPNSQEKKIVNTLLIDVLFFEDSNLIAGVRPKMLQNNNAATTSKAKETEIEKSFKINIEGISYEISGINIVHFDKNTGLLAIQVLQEVPQNVTNQQDWADNEGIKFAKYLAKSDYFNKATEKAKEIKLTLLDEIGVSFYDSKIGQGINTMIKKESYNQ